MYGFICNEDDIYMSYAPISNIFEQNMLARCLIYGFQIGYASDDDIMNDIQELKPTIFGSFSDFYKNFYKKTMSKIFEEFPYVQLLFITALQVKTHNYKNSGTVKHCFYDRLIFQSI